MSYLDNKTSNFECGREYSMHQALLKHIRLYGVNCQFHLRCSTQSRRTKVSLATLTHPTVPKPLHRRVHRKRPRPKKHLSSWQLNQKLFQTVMTKMTLLATLMKMAAMYVFQFSISFSQIFLVILSTSQIQFRVICYVSIFVFTFAQVT
jgi:hypothetical protein